MMCRRGDLPCDSWSRWCGRRFPIIGGKERWRNIGTRRRRSSTSCGRRTSCWAQGKTIAEACKQLGVTDHTYFRWRKAYVGLKVDQAKRLKELETENGRLKRVVAELTLDKLILKEVAEGRF